MSKKLGLHEETETLQFELSYDTMGAKCPLGATRPHKKTMVMFVRIWLFLTETLQFELS